MTAIAESNWSGGLADWQIDRTAYISVSFTWKLPAALSKAIWYRDLGYDVIVGGPATYSEFFPRYFDGVATVRRQWPDAVRHHNPAATLATRGCDERCFFCGVWKVEGPFSYYPDFPVRPVLCDNNLSAIETRYQDHIIKRYIAEDVPLLDANSGFEPKSFDRGVFDRWSKINRGCWRFGYDESGERDTVYKVMKMLREAGVAKRQIRPYVMIGCESFEDCMGRIRDVLQWGGDPHVQPYIKPTALERTPHVSRKMGWTRQLLVDVARWANGTHCAMPFEEYDRSAKGSREPEYDPQQGLFA